MIEKNNTVNDKYKLNRKTTVVVSNQRIEPDRGEPYYKVSVTLKHKFEVDNPKTFDNVDEIADFLNNIDLDDDQLALPLTVESV